MGAEQVGANLGILARFDAAQLGLAVIQHNGVNAQASKQRGGLLAGFGDQVAWEKSAVANNDAHRQRLWNSGHR